MAAIEVAPLAYMRGRTLNDAFVIIDEAHSSQGGETATDSRKCWAVRGYVRRPNGGLQKKASRTWKSCSVAWPSAAGRRT